MDPFWHLLRLLPAGNDVDGDPRTAARPASPRLARRRVAARELDEVMRSLGVTNGQLARDLGVDEKYVRKQRKGEAAFGLEDLRALSPRRRAALLARLAA